MNATVGRIVHFFPGTTDYELGGSQSPGPMAAIVTKVVGETIDLTVFPPPEVGRAKSVQRLSVAQAGSSSWSGPIDPSWDWPELV